MKKQYRLTVQDIEAATAALDSQRAAMGFLLPLPASGSKGVVRLANKAMTVAEQRLQAAREHAKSLPASFDLPRFENDVALMKALRQCRDAVALLHTQVGDTLNQIGTNVFRVSSEAYAHIKAAAATSPGLQRTVGVLGTRPKAGKEEEVAAPQLSAAPGPLPAPAVSPSNGSTLANNKAA